jgi:hypothetical protein
MDEQCKTLHQATDDELLGELSVRNRAVLYVSVRDIDSKGKPIVPTWLIKGGEMDILALLSRLIGKVLWNKKEV